MTKKYLENVSISKKEKEELKSQLEESNQKISELGNEIKQSKEDSDDKLSKQQDELKKSLDDIEILKKENSSLKETASDSQGSKELLKRIEAENEEFKKELEALKSKTVPKSDLDDLMLVLHEIDDEAKNKYKSKVKDLDGDVSSDEE